MLTKDEAIWKAIQVETLIDLLKEVPSGSLIAVSPVNELLVLTPDEKPQGLISISGEDYDPDLFERKVN